MQNMTQVELKVGMKEEHNGVLSHSDDYCKETDSINMKNLQHIDCQGKETDNSVLLKREDSFRTTSELEHSKVVNHVIKDTESGGRDSPNVNDVGEVLNNQLGTRGSKTLTSDEEKRDKVLNGPEFERTTALNDCANRDEHKLPDYGAQIITSKSFQADSNLYTDKSVMECEVPQLIVCCKDIDCQHVKDICVDKGVPLEEKGLIDKHTDNYVGPHVSKPSSECGSNETTENLNYEFHIPDGLRSSAQASMDRCEANEERNIISPVLSEPEYIPAGKVIENSPNPEAFMQASETNVGNKTEKYVLVEEPLVTTVLPLEKFGTRSSLQSCKDSLNSQGDEDSQQSNQSMKPDPKSSDAELKSEEPNQSVAEGITSDFSYEPTVADSWGMHDEVHEKTWKAEDVLNHNYRNISESLAAHVVQRADMDESEQEYTPESEFKDSNNPFLVSEIQCSGKDRSTVDTRHETLLKNIEGNSSNPFGEEVQIAIVEVSTEENLPATLGNHKKENFNPFVGKDTENVYQVSAESPKRRSTNNPFADCEDTNAVVDKNYESIDQPPDVSNKIASTNPFAVSEVHSSSDAKSIQYIDQQAELNHKLSSFNPFTSSEVEGAGPDKTSGNKLTVVVPEQQYLELRHLLNHEGAPKNPSFRDHGEAGLGETSFSAVSGRITYSGPIAVSGSTSLRSDSSTTSTRSFAFPVLQSEWNSSPVRMERADRRKQRGGWKHGILCCKF